MKQFKPIWMQYIFNDIEDHDIRLRAFEFACQLYDSLPSYKKVQNPVEYCRLMDAKDRLIYETIKKKYPTIEAKL